MTATGVHQTDPETLAADAAPPARAPGAIPARPRILVAMHWLTVLFVLVAVTLVLLREVVDGRTARQWLLEGHRHFGLLVLVLFALRVALRLRLGRLPAEDASRLLRLAGGLTHVALYTLLLALPLLGWAYSNSMAKPVHFFGATLPPLVSPDPDLADTLGAWHVDAAWALLGLVLLHIAAALWHHFVRHDGVLRRMLPQRRR